MAETLVQADNIISEPSGSTSLSEIMDATNDSCTFVQTEPKYTVVAVADKCSQTDKYVASENVQHAIQNKLLVNEIKLVKSELKILKTPQSKKNIFKTEETGQGSGKKNRESHDVQQTFRIENIKEDDKQFKFYTGLTYNQFLCLWQFLGVSAFKLNYWNSTVSDPERTPGKRRGPKRSILPMNELLLTLMRLRLGLLNADLAYRFHVSAKHVSTIVLTWIQFLYKRFSDLKRPMFAKRSMIKKHLPKCFKKYKNIRCIIDCTEVHVQQPSNFAAQGNAYSSYKGHTTFKFLVAVAPNGTIVYLSDAFQGSISDKEIVRQSGFLDYLDPGDEVMADRGFLIKDMLNERQVKLIIPPFLGNRNMFTPQEESLTKDVAKHRIHVERSIERMKKFRLLQKTIPLSLQPVFSQIVFVVGCLVNFQKPLVQ